MAVRSSVAGCARWGLAGALLGACATFVHFANFGYDDAFISFRYAENLASGQGLVFNVGERVEGYSNFAWTALMAVPALLGASRHQLGMLLSAKLLGAFASLSTLVASAVKSPSPAAAGRYELPVAALYLALLAPFSLWSVAGMETPLLGLLLVVIVVLDEREHARGWRGTCWSAVALWLAALTRPEPVLLLFPLLALRIGERQGRLRWNVSAGLRFASTFVVPYSAFLAFRRCYYGQWLPNTYFAKRASDPEAWARGLSYLGRAVDELWLLQMLAASVAVLLASRRWSRSDSVVVSLLLTHAASVVYEGGDWMQGHRLVVPALPLVGLLLQSAWRSTASLSWQRLHLPAVPPWLSPPAWGRAWNEALRVAERRSGVWARRALPRGGAAILLAVSMVSAYRSYGPWRGVLGSGWQRWEPTRGTNFAVAFWMRDHVTEPGLLATGEAGVIPYYTRLPLLDLFGLMDPHLAHLPGVRHRKFDADYVLARRPRYVALPVNRFSDGSLTGSQTYSETLLHDARFLRRYAVLHEFPELVLYVRVG